jgi:hypothetical protein
MELALDTATKYCDALQLSTQGCTQLLYTANCSAGITIDHFPLREIRRLENLPVLGFDN